MAERDVDGRLMEASSGGAARASDDGALLTVMDQPIIPELSLIGQQQHEQEQELGQRLADVCRGVGRCPSSCSCSCYCCPIRLSSGITG